MTATRARNPIGIFETKRAKFLAKRYNLDLLDKNCYAVSSDRSVAYSDVLFIVDNLWFNHFVNDTEPPIDNYTWVEYNDIYNKLCRLWPLVFNYAQQQETNRQIDRGLLG